MRDTLCLRARIALLACLPGLAGCSSSPSPEAQADAKGKRDGKAAAGEDGKSRKAPLRDLKARREARKAAAEAKADKPEAIGDPMEGEAPPQPAPVAGVHPPGSHAAEAGPGYPGDPPFIDGYNPEEATCVSGNWCGAKADALAVSVPGVGEELGCVARITGGGKSKEAIDAAPKRYEGLSAAPNMQGALNEHGTELARAKGSEDACCYHWFEYCSGRPHLGERGPVVAAVQPGDAWSRPSLAGPEPAPLPEALRQQIARAWLDDALAEHASVAAFARATLELLALGAPPRLVADAQRAGLDEIEHARLCFSLAGRYDGEARQPGPLEVPAPRSASLARLAADTFAEGCVGETIAALAAQRAARGVADPELRKALEQLADDEARHAALAWATVAWALRQGGVAVAERLLEAARSLAPEDDGSLPPEDPHASTLAAHGRLDARTHARVAQEAWADIIEPMLEQVLAAPAAARVETVAQA